MNYPSFADIARQHPLREMLSRYGIKVKAGGRFLCPYHHDKNPSASIFRADDGRDEGMCHSEKCRMYRKPFDSVQFFADREHNGDRNKASKILSGYQPMSKPQPRPAEQEPEFHLGPIPEDLIPVAARVFAWSNARGAGKQSVTPDIVHVYRDKAGVAQQLVIRSTKHEGGKRFSQVSWDMARQAFVGKSRKSVPLYGADRLAKRAADPVLVVEGEKCADILNVLIHEYVVVTWKGGTDNVQHQDFSALDGREVTWWPDADRPQPDEVEGKGERAMRKAMASCKPRLNWWIEPLQEWRDIKSGFDCVDLLDRSGGIAQPIRDVLQSLPTPIREPATALDSEPATSRTLSTEWLPRGQDLIHSLKDGRLKVSSDANHWLFLSHHPLLKGRFAWDEFDRKVLIDGQEMTEAMVRDLGVFMCSEPFNLEIKAEKLGPMVVDIASRNVVNRLRDYLSSLKWDGNERRLLDYAGVEDGHWSRVVSRRWSLGLVKRIMEPGCQHDGVLVLEGDQGVGKTTFLRVLGKSIAPGRDLLTTIHTMRLEGEKAAQLTRKAIVDMSELTAVRKSDTDAFKGMVTSTVDNFRKPYAKEYLDVPRTCVFAGTTNQRSDYLSDPTGNRRIWPVVMKHRPNLQDFNRDAEQIWAEMVARLLEGDQNWLKPDEEELQRAEVGTREAVDAWQSKVEEVVYDLAGTVITVEELWIRLELDMKIRNPHAQSRVKNIMEKLGWEKDQEKTGRRRRIWRRT